jgi:hypothetical protein
MDRRKVTLRIAAGLVLFTCLGHTAGTLMEVPAEQVAMRETIAVMQKTMVPMPMGAPRSYMQILDGNNLCVCLFLLVIGVQMWMLSSHEAGAMGRRLVKLNSLGLAICLVLAAVYFFPLPAACLGLAALLGLLSLQFP